MSKQKTYYGYPISSIIFRALIFIFIFLIIIVIINLNISIYDVILLSLIIIFIYVYIGIILFKTSFQKYRTFILKKMIDIADLKGDEIILDIGTGAGIIAIGFAKILKDGKVFAIDIYKHKYNNFKKRLINYIKINFFGNTIKNAQNNAKIENVEDICKFIKADITDKLNFPDNFFDIILTSQSLYCIPIKNHNTTFQQIDRILKKNGKVIFFEPKFFLLWDIKKLKIYFEKIGYSIKIYKNGKFKRMCLFVGYKIKSD